MTNRKTQKVFKGQLRLVQPNLEVVGEYFNEKSHVLVKDTFGLCNVAANRLLRGKPPTIRSAVNKTTYFINKAKSKHGDRYDYSKVRYVNSKTSIKVLCNIHGLFLSTPDRHLLGAGCSMCAIEARTKKITTKENAFITSCTKIHKNKYSYIHTSYKGSDKKIKILCNSHGVFEQLARNHLKGHGCSECFREEVSKKYSLTKNQFIHKANFIHNNFYDYSKVVYENNRTKIKIDCKYHGTFLQTPNSHLSGDGCPVCGEVYKTLTFGQTVEEAKKIPYNLYILEFSGNGEFFWKIGIAKNINKRLKSFKKTKEYIVCLLHHIDMSLLASVTMEQKLLKKYKRYKYRPKIAFNGKSECFSKNPIECFTEFKSLLEE